jgi:hypothetical protein
LTIFLNNLFTNHLIRKHGDILSIVAAMFYLLRCSVTGDDPENRGMAERA